MTCLLQVGRWENQYLGHGPLHHHFLGQDTEHSGQVLHVWLLIGSHRSVHVHPVGERVVRAWKKKGENAAHDTRHAVRSNEFEFYARPSPGTASCLRGMALSLEGSEPIQSALALPMPAGRVFMSETARHQPTSSQETVLHGTLASATPMRKKLQDIMPKMWPLNPSASRGTHLLNRIHGGTIRGRQRQSS